MAGTRATTERRPYPTCVYCESANVDYRITTSVTQRDTYRCLDCGKLFEIDPEED